MTDVDFEQNASRALDVLHVSPERFWQSPQVGVPARMTWDELAHWLSAPRIGTAKDEAGAWSPARYRDNVRRKENVVSVDALTLDIDQGGDVDRAASVVRRYSAIMHETFSSTDDAPRCRIVILFARPIDVPTYEATHKIARAHLAAAGLPADEGAKDPSRLSYAPVRRSGQGYRFRRVDGAPLDAHAVLDAQPPPLPRPVARTVLPAHRGRYARGALRHAADNVSTASEGERHFSLCREAFALARLGLTEDEIMRALLPAFVAAAGERRAAEGMRTVRDSVRARSR